MNTGKIPEWESELWHLISNSDGTHCPHATKCETRGHGNWCLDNYKDAIAGLYGKYTQGLQRDDIERFMAEINQYLPARVSCGRVFELIDALANKYLEKAAITEPPVPVNVIDYLEIDKPVEIRLIPMKAYHGAVWDLDEGWIIQINSIDPPERQRLNIFHEIFHVVAHSKAMPVFRKRGMSEGYFNEILADCFSGCMLMPREWIKKKWAEEKDIKRMAKIFNVTEIGIWIRLRTMGLI